jgi:hypothetical protein
LKTQIILIDFDGTISPIHGFHEPPKSETIMAIKQLHKMYGIGIYSCRSNLNICDESDHRKMIDYLNKWSIPYDFIEFNKPLYKCLIDDRSLNPNIVSWKQITEELLK